MEAMETNNLPKELFVVWRAEGVLIQKPKEIKIFVKIC